MVTFSRFERRDLHSFFSSIIIVSINCLHQDMLKDFLFEVVQRIEIKIRVVNN
jgi:hypothetical protein